MKKTMYLFIMILFFTVLIRFFVKNVNNSDETILRQFFNGNYEVVGLKEFKTNNKKYTFLTTVKNDEWEESIYELDSNGSLNLITGGNKYLFDYDVILINGAYYLYTYEASHMGNGSVVFRSLDNLKEEKYKFYAIDIHMEEIEETAIKYGISQGYDENILASEVYEDGKLNINFIDINSDGLTDIVLNGVKKIVMNCDDGINLIFEKFYVEKTYVYESINDTFNLINNTEYKISNLK